MAWLWDTWDEYIKSVQPVTVTSRGIFNFAQRGSLFETENELLKAVQTITSSIEALGKLGLYSEGDNLLADLPLQDDPSILEKARELAWELVRAGEELLLYHKRLAKSNTADGFLHQNEIITQWERYEGSPALAREIEQLITDAEELLRGYRELKRADDEFLLLELNLPPDLEADFRLARNLFSVGLDDVGLLISGRGLEGVLRTIAKNRKIVIAEQAGKKSKLAYDVDLSSLINVMSQLRWKVTDELLLNDATKALLHYIRTLRNGVAHGGRERKRGIGSSREMAAIIAKTANQLWNDVAKTRVALKETTIGKTW